MLAEKFTEDTPLPLAGSVGYLTRTGQRARVQRNNGDGTAFVQLFQRRPGSNDWLPITGSSGNTTVQTGDLHPTIKAAVDAGLKGQVAAHPQRTPRPRRARRTAR